MLSLDGATKQEVNQSPLAFVETPIQANVEQALARKDAIIRVRNAQVSVRAGCLLRHIRRMLLLLPSHHACHCILQAAMTISLVLRVPCCIVGAP